MRKILAILLAVMLIASMAVPAFAVTPKWKFSLNIPEIKPDTSFVQGAVSKWFKENPIDLPAFNISFTSPTLN